MTKRHLLDVLKMSIDTVLEAISEHLGPRCPQDALHILPRHCMDVVYMSWCSVVLAVVAKANRSQGLPANAGAGAQPRAVTARVTWRETIPPTAVCPAAREPTNPRRQSAGRTSPMPNLCGETATSALVLCLSPLLVPSLCVPLVACLFPLSLYVGFCLSVV